MVSSLFGLKRNGINKNPVLHVEWCKAYARMRRWHKDIVLVKEEMRCMIEFGSYMAEEWQWRSASRRVPMNPALAEGLRAYALEHVAWEQTTASKLSTRWTGVREKARLYMAGVPVEGGGPHVVIDLDLDEVDPTDLEGDVAGDELVDGEGQNDADEEDPNDI
jgi:hypothetical protein